MKAPQDSTAKTAFSEFMTVPLSDQFGNGVEWQLFESVPRVLLFAGKEAGAAAKDWGIFLQKTFNPTFRPTPQHLQTLVPEEHIKVIAVATLPEVPLLFRGLFRSGFRSDAKDMGLALDFSRALSKQFSYDGSETLPLLVMLRKGGPAKGSQIVTFQGLISDVKLQKQVATQVRKLLPSSAPKN